MTSPFFVRFVGSLVVAAGTLAVVGDATAQLAPRPSTTPPAAAGPSGSGGSRFAPPPAASGSDRLPSTAGSGTGSGGLLGSGGSGSSGSGAVGGGIGGSSAIPRTTSPASSGSSGGITGGGIYGGAIPGTSDSGSSYGGGAGAGGSSGLPYGGSGSSSGSSLGSPSGGSSLGTPSSVIPRTPASGGLRGGLPYESTPAAEPPSESSSDGDAPAIGSRTGDAVGMNGIETKGYALIGPSAHHYIFGNLAIADYIDRGQRRIVSLELEANLPKDDPNFIYYRELRDGNRWAFATKAGTDLRYAVYFQPGDAAAGDRTKWRRIQRAQLQWNRRMAPAAESMVFE